MARARAFAAAGLLPTSLLGWELYAYVDKVQRSRTKKQTPKLVEGSTLWLAEREAQTLDVVLFRRRLGAFGPSAALADFAHQRVDASAPYDGVGVVVVERDGVPRVLRAGMDGAVTCAPLAAVLKDTADYDEVLVKPLAWPDRGEAVADARKFAAGAVVRCGGGDGGARGPWDTLADARVAPLVLPREAWPRPPGGGGPLRARVDGAVSPGATLVLELLCACNVVAPQHRDAALVPADFANDAVPLRRGARYAAHVLTVKAPNFAAPQE